MEIRVAVVYALAVFFLTFQGVVIWWAGGRANLVVIVVDVEFSLICTWAVGDANAGVHIYLIDEAKPRGLSTFR